MRKLLSIGLSAILVIGLAGCNGTVTPVTNGTQTSTAMPSTSSAQTTVGTQTTQSSPLATVPATAPVTVPATVPVTTPATTPVTVPSTTTAMSKPVDATFYPINKAVNVDLDGDGTKEKILYTGKDLRINGVSQSQSIKSDVWSNEPNQKHFVIVDINSVDPSKEIGILTDGPSDDYETFFYSYSNGYLSDIGSVPAIMDDLSKSFDGKGYIYGDKRLSVLQTWYAPARWKLEGQTVFMDPDDLYYPIVYDYQKTVILKEDLPIYKNIGDPDPTGTMKPQKVEFLATDNSNWCQIKGKDGTTGWFKFDRFDHLLDLNKSAMDVFDQLANYD